jgi:proteasome lid subunit RPN8/RPN11
MAEIADNPDVEVGGKFIGYINSRSSTAGRRGARLNNLEVEIWDYLDSGPETSRSAVYHHPDTDYQLELFQRIEKEYPGLSFVGVWHSHHPNGLRDLSGGDIQAHWGTVNSPRYDLDIMISSVAFDDTGILGGRVFVFPRGARKRYYEIGAESIQVIRGPNEIHAALEAHAESLRTRHSMNREQEWTPARGMRDAGWRNTEEGQISLATDQAWLTAHPGMRPYARNNTVLWRGHVRRGSQVFNCAYAYPDEFPESPPFAAASITEDGIEITISVTLEKPRTRSQEFLMLLDTLDDALKSHIEVQMTESPEGLAQETTTANDDG